MVKLAISEILENLMLEHEYCTTNRDFIKNTIKSTPSELHSADCRFKMFYDFKATIVSAHLNRTNINRIGKMLSTMEQYLKVQSETEDAEWVEVHGHIAIQMILWNLRQGIDFHSDLSDNNQVRIPFFENADSHFNFRDYEKRVNAQKWWARSKGADISADRFTKGIYKTVEYDGDALSDDDEEAKELDETKVKDLLKSCSMTKCRQVILKLLNKVESRVMPPGCSAPPSYRRLCKQLKMDSMFGIIDDVCDEPSSAPGGNSSSRPVSLRINTRGKLPGNKTNLWSRVQAEKMLEGYEKYKHRTYKWKALCDDPEYYHGMGCRSKKQVYAKFRLIVRKNKRREKLRAYLADVAAGVPPPCPSRRHPRKPTSECVTLTEDQIHALVQGIKKIGEGKWVAIKESSPLLKSVPLGVLSNKHYSMLAAKETQFLRKESLLHSQSACTADGADGDDGTSDHNHSIDSASQRQTRTLREDGRADGCHVSDTGDDDRTAGQDDYWTNHSQRSGSRNSDGNSNEAGSSSSVESDLGDDDDEEDDSRGGGARIVVKFTAKGMVKCSPAKRSKAVVSTSSSSASRVDQLQSQSESPTGSTAAPEQLRPSDEIGLSATGRPRRSVARKCSPAPTTTATKAPAERRGKRRRWEPEAEDMLRLAYARHKDDPKIWAVILKDPDFSAGFVGRTNINLKDKWRNILKGESSASTAAADTAASRGSRREGKRKATRISSEEDTTDSGEDEGHDNEEWRPRSTRKVQRTQAARASMTSSSSSSSAAPGIIHGSQTRQADDDQEERRIAASDETGSQKRGGGAAVAGDNEEARGTDTRRGSEGAMEEED